MDFFIWILLALALYIVVQLIRLYRADGDLSLMYAEAFGNNPETLRGKVVWITGASSGIGEHLAYKLAKHGCRLVLSARRENELRRVAEKCQRNWNIDANEILVLPMDVLKYEDHERMMKTVMLKFGHVDILVNNAGRTQRSKVIETSFEVERQIIELNYFSCVSLTKVVLPHMIERGEGHLVFNSSIMGKFGLPNVSGYAASKHALQGWCYALGTEVAHNNIHVTTVCPGPVFSGVQRAAFTPTAGEEYGVDMNPSDRRMSTERCAELFVVAMCNRLREAWISNQPGLTTTYLVQYAPSLAYWLVCTFGNKAVIDMRSANDAKLK